VQDENASLSDKATWRGFQIKDNHRVRVLDRYMLAVGRAAGIRVLGSSRQLSSGEHTPVELQLKYTVLYLEVGSPGDLMVTRIAPSSSSYMPG